MCILAEYQTYLSACQEKAQRPGSKPTMGGDAGEPKRDQVARLDDQIASSRRSAGYHALRRHLMETGLQLPEIETIEEKLGYLR